MSEKHKPVPVAWARMKCGNVISVFHDKDVAEFLSGFAASELVPLYMHAEQPAPDVAALVEALDGAARSLGTISRQAGIDEYMCDFLEVRGYARNRSMVAFEALAAHRQQGGES